MVRIQQAYGLSGLEEVLPLPIKASAAPASTDINFALGQVWLDTVNGLSYILAKKASGSATWNAMAPGASDVDTISGDSGGNRPPSSGNIVIAGGTNLTSVGATSTITVNMDAAIVLATSVSAPLYTAAAGIDLDITSPANQNVVMKLGDAGGTQKFSITDSADVEQFAVDSDGGLTMGAVTFTGLLTASASATIETAGTALNLGSDNNSAAVNLGVGTTARAIGIGDSAAAHTITIGSTTAAASLTLQAGTGNFVLNGAATTTYTVGAATTSGTITIGGTAQTGTMTLGDSSGTNIVQIGSGEGATTVAIAGGATNAKAVDIGIGAIGNVIRIGTNTAAASLAIKVGTGNYNLDGAATSTYTVAAATTSGTITIGGTAQTGTFSIGDTSGTMILELGAGEGATTVAIAGGATNAKAVDIGIGAVANVIRIGTVSGAASLAIKVGTGNYDLDGAATSTYTIGASTTSGTIDIGGTAQTGTLTLGDSSGTNIVQIGSGEGATTVAIAGGATNAKVVTIADGAVAQTVTIGSVTSTSALTLLAGSGNITMTGTIEAVDAKFSVPTGIDITLATNPTMTSAGTGGGVATGATGDLNIMALQEGVVMEQFILGAGQTIISPRMVTDGGLNIALDQVDDEGAEYNFGAASETSRFAFTVGTSAAFQIDATFKVADSTGCEPLLVGFRKAEANNATVASYDTFASIGLRGASATDKVVLSTNLSGGGNIITDTTDAFTDGQTHKLSVLVSAAGVVTYLIDGSAPSTTAAITFDNADVVCPFIHFLNGTDVAGNVELTALKIGFQ